MKRDQNNFDRQLVYQQRFFTFRWIYSGHISILLLITLPIIPDCGSVTKLPF